MSQGKIPEGPDPAPATSLHTGQVLDGPCAAALVQRLDAVRARIHTAERAAGRPHGAVRLLAVSKKQPAASLAVLHAQGQTCFGESYLQEALEKISTLQALAIEWHFIGPLQSNKTRSIAQNFDWVHSLDRLKLAQRLAAQRPETLAPLNVCIQVNISGEDSKHGLAVADVPALCQAVRALPRLRLRGLMALPARETHPLKQARPFEAMRRLFDTLNDAGEALDTLSMGMSGDLEAAVAAGSNLVRVGTDLFGPRSP